MAASFFYGGSKGVLHFSSGRVAMAASFFYGGSKGGSDLDGAPVRPGCP